MTVTPVVIYAPTARNRGSLIEQCQQHCQREGYQAVAITPLPAEALRLVVTGEAVTIVHARRRDARALRPPLEQARPSRHGPPHAAIGAVVGAGLLHAWRQPWNRKLATAAAIAASGVGAALLLPVLATPEPVDPGLVEPPPVAAPPVDVYPDLPAPEPEPLLVPESDPAGDPISESAKAPEMQQVAVTQPAPEPSAPPTRSELPEPSPTPEPRPEPVPSPAPEPEPAVDPLLCADLAASGLVELELCLLS